MIYNCESYALFFIENTAHIALKMSGNFGENHLIQQIHSFPVVGYWPGTFLQDKTISFWVGREQLRKSDALFSLDGRRKKGIALLSMTITVAALYLEGLSIQNIAVSVTSIVMKRPLSVILSDNEGSHATGYEILR